MDLILSNLAQLRLYVSVKTDLRYESVEPYIRHAEDTHLPKMLGATFLQAIRTAVRTGKGGNYMKELQQLLQSAIAPLAVYYYTQENELQIGEAGLLRTETDNAKAGYKDQVLRLQTSLYKRGLANLDAALAFLFENGSEFQQWDATSYNAMLVRSGAEFNNYYACQFPQQVYLSVQTIMQSVEGLTLSSALGDTYEYLKDRQASGELTAIEKIAVRELKFSLCYLTVSRAIPQMELLINGDGITQLSTAAETQGGPSSKRQAASKERILELQRQTQSLGEQHLDAALKYIEANASGNDFTAWQPTPAPDNATYTPTDINKTLKGSFGL